jgi:phenylalanyl-tRNA synthetase beta chain
LHPAVAASWELGTTATWALNLGRLVELAPAVTAYETFGAFPAVREDLAVVVADSVSAAAVIAVVRQAAGPGLVSVEPFDVYRGEQIGPGRVSLALHLEFRAADRTLTDAEVAAQRAQIEQALHDELGGTLRA